VDIIKKYELIRPILKHEKTPEQISKEANIPLSTVYYYLKRFRESGENMASLAEKSHTSHSHPEWLPRKDRDKVVQYKLKHPHLSSRQIARELTQEGVLQIHDRTVSNILKERGLTTPFLSISHPN
jgi:transposase